MKKNLSFLICFGIIIFLISCANPQYTVKYDLNYENSIKITKTYEEGENIELFTPKQNGYIFQYWCIDQECLNECDSELTINSNLILYAKWEKEANKYIVNYDANGGLVDNENIKTIDYYENEEVSLLIPVKNGYIFIGWFLDTDTSMTNEITSLDNNNYNLVAKWEMEKEKAKYIVNYDANGGLVDNESNKTIEYYTDEPVDLLRPIREGYEFVGWFLDTDTSMTNEITYLNNKDYNLVAKWAEVLTSDIPNIELSTSTQTYKDVTYKIANNTRLKMDIRMPVLEEGKKYPVLFFFYGGGWFYGDKSDISYVMSVVLNLVKNGYIVVAPNYRLVSSSNGIRYPYPVMDIMDSIRYIVKYQNEFQADVDCMGAIGYSAGGYFSLMAGFAQDYFYEDESLRDYNFKLKFIVDMFGPAIFDIDMINSLSGFSLSMLRGFFGEADLKQEKFASGFPNYYLDNNNPNILIIHGEEDSIVPIKQSQDLEIILKEKGMNINICKRGRTYLKCSIRV